MRWSLRLWSWPMRTHRFRGDPSGSDGSSLRLCCTVTRNEAETVSPPNCIIPDAFMPENRLLIQVVPQLRPAACGVSDHAISLAQELEARFGIDTAFVVLNSTEPCDSPFPREYCKPARLAEVCNSLSKGQAGAILVHYSGYGYSPDGAPFPLVEALQN